MSMLAQDFVQLCHFGPLCIWLCHRCCGRMSFSPSGLDLHLKCTPLPPAPRPPHLHLKRERACAACLPASVGVVASRPNEYPESCWHSVGGGERSPHTTLLKLRPAESFSLGRSSCSWASRMSTSCSMRRTDELTSPANTGPCVWRASSLAKLAAFSPLRI